MDALFGHLSPDVVQGLLWAIELAGTIIMTFCPAASVAFRLAAVIVPMIRAAHERDSKPSLATKTAQALTAAPAAVVLPAGAAVASPIGPVVIQGPPDPNDSSQQGP